MTTNLASIRSSGFLREDAGLSVLVLADDRDICSGPTTLFQYYDIYNSPECRATSAKKTFDAVAAAKGNQPVFYGAIVNLSDAYMGGHGYVPVAPYNLPSLVGYAGTMGLGVSISTNATSSYNQMVALGKSAVRTALPRPTTFTVPSKTFSVASVSVAGRQVAFSYDMFKQEVSIAPQDSGNEGDPVEVSSCEMKYQ
jgi:hypothetical protein